MQLRVSEGFPGEGAPILPLNQEARVVSDEGKETCVLTQL